MSAIPVDSKERTNAILLLQQNGYIVDNLCSGLVMHRQGSLSAYIEDDGVYFVIHDMPWLNGRLYFDYKDGSKNFQLLLAYLK